jgi:AcrR family transcriptional regulator
MPDRASSRSPRSPRLPGSLRDSDGQPPSLRERILVRALERFNAEGIEYLGVRELAKDLGVKGGHITYYFPTKDDLVAAVGGQLREVNDATISVPETPSLHAFLGMLRQVFLNHYRFRCLFLSLPHLLAHNEKVAAGYLGAVEQGRREVLAAYLGSVRDAGELLASTSADEIERLVGFTGLVSRGWIGDAAISHRDRSPRWCMVHYLRVVCDHLRGFATEQGHRELARFEEELEAWGRKEGGEP